MKTACTLMYYCNSLLTGLLACGTTPLKLIQNSAAWLVNNLPNHGHATPLISLGWLPITAHIIRFKSRYEPTGHLMEKFHHTSNQSSHCTPGPDLSAPTSGWVATPTLPSLVPVTKHVCPPKLGMNFPLPNFFKPITGELLEQVNI